MIQTDKTDIFGSLNAYSGLQVIEAKQVKELLAKIAEIKTPISVKWIFPYGNRVYAIIGGDVRVKRTRKTKEK